MVMLPDQKTKADIVGAGTRLAGCSMEETFIG
jgi:hypothetical protein